MRTSVRTVPRSGNTEQGLSFLHRTHKGNECLVQSCPTQEYLWEVALRPFEGIGSDTRRAFMLKGLQSLDYPQIKVCKDRPSYDGSIQGGSAEVSSAIRVFYYPDRVEVHSPGLLLPGITVEQMERGEVQSKLRNPILAGLLRDIPGYMERIGSGSDSC